MTREEHLAWAKRRALKYLDAGDLKEAFTRRWIEGFN